MPPFAKQRRNTVYDLTALRIHHDDFRIPSSDSNYRYRRDKKITRDVRGNWIAKDAGGTGKVPWYKKVDGGEDDEEEEEGKEMEVDEKKGENTADNTEREDGDGNGDESSEDEEYRRGQRRRFYEDMSYLDEHADIPQPSGSMPVPDSDLLKTIHYFTSVYYSDMGQLYDAKVRAAQLKKRKRMQDEDSPEPSEAKGEGKETVNDELEMEGEDEDEEGDEGEEGWVDEADVVRTDEDEEGSRPRKRQALSKGKGKERDNGQSATSKRRIARRGRKRVDRDWTEIHRNQNMYRRFDGSALMALGMLVQEFVKENVKSPMPLRRGLQKDGDKSLPPGTMVEPGDQDMKDQEAEEEGSSDEGEESPTVVGVDEDDSSESDDD